MASPARVVRFSQYVTSRLKLKHVAPAPALVWHARLSLTRPVLSVQSERDFTKTATVINHKRELPARTCYLRRLETLRLNRDYLSYRNHDLG